MEMSNQIAQGSENATVLRHLGNSIDVQREVLCAGSRLKRITCSRLLGEISEQQFDLQRTELLRQIRLLTA